MALESSKKSGKPIAAAIAIAAALTAALLSAPAGTAQADEAASSLTIAPLAAQSNESDYFIALRGIPYEGEYGIYGKPGEKLVIRAYAETHDIETWEGVPIEGATVKWTSVSSKLKASKRGNKLVINKLPKAGTYKFTVAGYDENGKKLCKATYKIVVKKKPSLKIQMSINGDKSRTKSNYSWAYANEDIMLTMAGAKFGWDNNTKKPFYTWTVKDLGTGKTATWNTIEEVFERNPIIGGGSAYGGSTPYFMGRFFKAGTFKITAKMYHSNRKIATAAKVVTIY